MNKLRLLVVDDHRVVRDGLVSLISYQADMAVVASGGDGQSAIELFQAHRPDVTLMDLSMPVMDGIAGITAIRRLDPSAKILVLTTYDGDEDIHRALEAGAAGYLLKDCSADDLLNAIRDAASGQLELPERVRQEYERRKSEPAGVSQREREVLELVVQGLTNKEIGRRLSISEPTVKAHLTHIFLKLDVKDRAEAVVVAVRRGFMRL